MGWANITSSAASSSKETDLKGILSHSLFFHGKEGYFSLKNGRCKDYISSQFVETTHLRLICIRRNMSRPLSTRKKKTKSDYQVFLFMFLKFQHLEGLMTFGDN